MVVEKLSSGFLDKKSIFQSIFTKKKNLRNTPITLTNQSTNLEYPKIIQKYKNKMKTKIFLNPDLFWLARKRIKKTLMKLISLNGICYH